MAAMGSLRSIFARLFVRAASAAVLALATVACAGSGYQYVADQDTQTYFKVPDDWRLYSQNELTTQSGPINNEFRDAQNPTLFLQAFAANADAPVADLPNAGADFPNGFTLVRTLSPTERDGFSLGAIRNLVFPLDQLAQDNPDSVVLFDAKDISTAQGMRGTQLIYSLRQSTDAVRQFDRSVTVNQTGMIDQLTQQVYLFVVFCTSDCYQRNKTAIDQVVQSWTVEAKV